MILRALLFWWFAIVSQGEIHVLSVHHTEAGCNIIRNGYLLLGLKTMKITDCLEKSYDSSRATQNS